MIAFTGHRRLYRPDVDWLTRVLAARVVSYFQAGERDVTCGMAMGSDLLWAELALAMGMNVHCHIPFWGWDAKFGSEDKATVLRILARAASVTPHLDRTFRTPRSEIISSFHVRNRAMVDASTELVAAWNGGRRGGTAETVRYARGKRMGGWQYNPQTLLITPLEEVRLW